MNQPNNLKVLGLMSGTSMDGLDMCLAEIKIAENYSFNYKIMKSVSEPFQVQTKTIIQNAIDGKNIEIAHTHLGKLFSQLCTKYFASEKIDAIAMHGQTINHEDGVMTHQIGDPQFLAETFQIPIIYNFRQADINVGGNGAPLMPFLDWLLFNNSSDDQIILNIGGIANFTHIPQHLKKGDTIGFDTGPGMALIDEFCKLKWNEACDWDGKYSSTGKIIEPLLAKMMKHPFVKKEYPKSTGRDEFGEKFVKKIVGDWDMYPPENILRTFVAFTAKSIYENILKLRNFTPENSTLIVSGGGVHHPIIMEDLKRYTQLKVMDSTEMDIDPDTKEALLMAVIGGCRLKNLTANMPSVTGAKSHVVLGDIYQRNE
ncbi:MAG: anhydro-N-acetylmuramic acid kinase [Candidatus Marinimicrobia bacterium]|nr:anhydro-N-acetylmuramic acid kinase [Candidatus Neomarinimicrobiota bacterium]